MGIRKLKRDKKGFTLIEIIVVLAILAILIAVAIPTMNGVLNDAKEKVVLADARAAYIAYVLKSADTTSPSLADITAYIDKESGDAVAIAVTKSGSTVTDFYYRDSRLAAGKYVHLPVGTSGSSATIIDALPEGVTALT